MTCREHHLLSQLYSDLGWNTDLFDELQRLLLQKYFVRGTARDFLEIYFPEYLKEDRLRFYREFDKSIPCKLCEGRCYCSWDDGDGSLDFDYMDYLEREDRHYGCQSHLDSVFSNRGIRTVRDVFVSGIANLNEFEINSCLFDQSNREPGHITGSGIVIRGKKVLLTRRNVFGGWVLPGSHVAPEDIGLDQTVRRAIQRKTGFEGISWVGIVDTDVLPSSPSKNGKFHHNHYDVRLGYLGAGVINISGGEWARSATWVPVEQALQMDKTISRPIRHLLDLVGHDYPRQLH